MGMKKLKSCPFCGRKPKITDLGQVKILSCEYSGCRIHPRIVYTWKEEEEKKAIDAWNSRTDGIENNCRSGGIND